MVADVAAVVDVGVGVSNSFPLTPAKAGVQVGHQGQRFALADILDPVSWHGMNEREV